MGVKLHKIDPPKGVPVGTMRDGDIAEIVAWPREEYLGQIVQKYHEFLVAVGMEYGHGWGKFSFATEKHQTSDFRVRILEPGEVLEIT